MQTPTVEVDMHDDSEDGTSPKDEELQGVDEELTLQEYVLRDPLLFGDYRNALHDDEPRCYEDLLDYEVVYSLLQEVSEKLDMELNTFF